MLGCWRGAVGALPALGLPFCRAITTAYVPHNAPIKPDATEVLSSAQQLVERILSNKVITGHTVSMPLMAAVKGKLRPTDLTPEQWQQLGTHLSTLRVIIQEALEYFNGNDVSRSILALQVLSSSPHVPNDVRAVVLSCVELLRRRALDYRVLKSLSDWNCASLLHVLARMQVQDPQMCTTLWNKMKKNNKLSELPGPKLADLAWALARHRCKDADLQELSRVLADRNVLASVLPQRLCFVAWSFAVLGHADVQFASALASFMLEEDNLSRCDNIGLSLLVWGLARVDMAEPRLMAAIADHLTQPGVLSSFTVQSFCNTIWGFARLDLTTEPLRAAFMEYLRQPGIVPSMQWQGVANVVWALGKLSLHDGPILEALATNLLQGSIVSLTPQETQFILWGFAALGVDHPALVATLAAHMRDSFDFPALSATDVGVLSTLLATLNVQDDALLAKLLSTIPEGRGLDWPENAMANVHLLALHVQLEPKKFPASTALSAKLQEELKLCREAFEAENAEAPTTELHRNVVDHLWELNEEVEGYSLLTAAGSLPVDAVIHARRRAFLVLGPSCFLRDGAGWHPTGSTMLRQRLLRGFYYRPCVVPFYEWDALRNERACDAYLQKLLL